MTDNKLIIRNTLYLLFRLFITVLSGLYISRVVLQELGATDFGIYNVVGGIIALMTIFTGSLSSSVSRFFNFQMGIDNNISELFSTALMIHLLLSGIVLIIGLSCGDYIINNILNIPKDKLLTSKYVFIITMAIFISNLMIIPYSSILIAYENMKTYSFLGIVDTFIKLLMLVPLININHDKLLIYAILQLLISLIILSIYILYCSMRYKEVRVYPKFNMILLKKIGGFSGWNAIGVFANIIKEQGVNILINVFSGPSMNTARGIAFQIISSLSLILNNTMLAVNPRITKLYASNEVASSYSLMEKSARLTACFMMLLIVPLLISLDSVLNLWLIDVPKYTRFFAYLALINLMVDSFSYPLISLMLANGNIKSYQLLVGFINIISLPLCYIVLKNDFSAYMTMYVLILLSAVNLFARLYMLARKVDIKKLRYLTHVVFRVLSVFVTTLIISTTVSKLFVINSTILTVLINTVLSALIVIMFIYIFCLEATERKYIYINIKSYMR
ncbi:hypothetical protein ABRP72_10110 [Pectobacterium carotovorum]|uniref:lipopolysaccharide biosynthesis protein n=1 Tax=Pectobacterium carotovorum TaxID=554 RepID=UPI0032EDB522